MRPLFILLSLILFTFTLTRAQESTPEPADGWTIEQRCVAEPTTPPDDWSFDGTILMTNPYLDQLHAYQQGWETPRILVFSGESRSIPYSGQLSPDGRWYAVIDGYRQDINMIVTWQTEAIHIYSTVNDEEFIVPWDNWFAASHTLGGHGLYWIGNEQLLYSMDDSNGENWFLINPFTNEVSDWNAEFNPSWDYFFLSPDGEKAIYRNGWGPDWTYLHNGEREIPITLFRPAWHPDSSQFAGYSAQTEVRAADQLVLFDLEGNITDTIFDVPDEVPYFFQTIWSSDGRYLLFGFNQLYIADLQEKRLIDTCIVHSSPLTASWSPTNSQIALLEPYRGTREVQVLDFVTWQRYIVAYHTGSILGWRADD